MWTRARRPRPTRSPHDRTDPDRRETACRLESACARRRQAATGEPERLSHRRAHSRRRGTEAPRARQRQWRSSYAGISVPVFAEWRLPSKALGEVIKLRAGDVIPLDRELIHDTRLRLSDNDEFAGTLGVQNDHLAVQLRQRLPQS